MDVHSSFDTPKTGSSLGGRGLFGLDSKGEFAGVSALVVEAVEVTLSVAAVVDLGMSPCASSASRAAFSLALLALSNTSSWV